MIEYIDQHGPPRGLPPDMLIVSTGRQDKDLFLAGVKNRPIQRALCADGVRYDIDGIREALQWAPSSRTDPPAHHSGPTAFLVSQLKLIVKLRGVSPWKECPRDVQLCADAAERFRAFNRRVSEVDSTQVVTLRGLVARMRDLSSALRETCSDTCLRYVPMRQARAAVTVHGHISDFHGVSLPELREISPDKTDALEESRCRGLQVSDVNWHGVQPQHWSMWVCLFKSPWSRQRYFRY